MAVDNKRFRHKKSLGQNFLKTESLLDLIATSSAILNNETVLEIGPGQGALTSKLLDKIKDNSGSKLICIEKDSRLIPFLKDKYHKEEGLGQIKIIEDDILKFDTQNTIGWGNYKLIANIPYYITGAILEKFLESTNKPKLIIVMVQKEVADRVISKNNKETILSLATKFYGDSEILKVVKPGNFNPPPKVDSAILKIVTHEKYSNDKKLEEFYLNIVKSGLAHKRKKLISNLKNFDGVFDWVKLFLELNIDNNTRGEDLGFEVWIKIAENYSNKRQ